MKLLHLSDLHLGKRLHEHSLLEDQAHVLLRLPEQIRACGADAVILAGDLYDRPVPPAEAVTLLDTLLNGLAETGKPVFIISGNHDSAGRLAFGAQLMRHSGIYFSPVYNGQIAPITLWDEFGAVDFWLLPFLKPASVRPFFPDAVIDSYEDAVKTALAALPVDTSRRNVLIAHQYITGAALCESEEMTVGGLDNISATLFDSFDYVALGHLHSPQWVGRSTIRYSGSPLAYSFSESDQTKSFTLTELGEKGSVDITLLPIEPMHDLRTLRGSYLDLSARSFYAGTAVDDYLRIILTDEEYIPDAAARLRTIYPNLLHLEYDNTRSRSEASWMSAEAAAPQSPLELFDLFFTRQNGRPMTPAQRTRVQELLDPLQQEP